MTSSPSLWNRMFPRIGPHDLAVSRILFFALLFYRDCLRMTADWVPFAAYKWTPLRVSALLDVGLFQEPVLYAIDTVWKLALLAAMLGLFTRLSTVLAFLLGAYIFCIPHNVGRLVHGDGMIVFVLMGLACSRCGDALSLDAWRRRRRGEAAPPSPSAEYSWPLRYVWTGLMLVYFGAGLAKFRASGWAWTDGESFSNYLLSSVYNRRPPTDLGLVLARSTTLCGVIATTVLVVELAAPLALFHRVLRFLIVPSLFLMQVGVKLMMGIPADKFFILYVFFVPWAALGRRLGGARKGAIDPGRSYDPSRDPAPA